MDLIPYIVVITLVITLLPFLLWAIGTIIWAFFGDMIIRQRKINQIRNKWKKDEH